MPVLDVWQEINRNRILKKFNGTLQWLNTDVDRVTEKYEESMR